MPQLADLLQTAQVAAGRPTGGSGLITEPPQPGAASSPLQGLLQPYEKAVAGAPTQPLDLNRLADQAADLYGRGRGRQQQAGAQIQGANQAVNLAVSQLGAPYVWAAMNPEGRAGGPGSGFDCSGLVKWVYSRLGVELPHMASQQQQQTQQVGRDQLQPGDLVFFAIPGGNYKGPNTASHVGIYIGNGQMIDASSSNDRIMQRNVFWDYFIGGGRVS